jgi:hypothetical protein
MYEGVFLKKDSIFCRTFASQSDDKFGCGAFLFPDVGVLLLEYGIWLMMAAPTYHILKENEK